MESIRTSIKDCFSQIKKTETRSTLKGIRTVNVLLIGDNSTSIRLIEQKLIESKKSKFVFIHECKISKGIKVAFEGGIDVILLDLSLEDSLGLDTLYKVHFKLSNIPIVALVRDEETGHKAILNGAKDYLVKEKFESINLERSICYAIEKFRASIEAEANIEQKYYEKEIENIQNVLNSKEGSLKGKLPLKRSIEETYPEIFNEIVISFSNLLELALIQKISKRTEISIPGELSEIAERLGVLNAGIKDVLEIYRKALKEITLKSTIIKSEAFAEEGQLMVSEITGFLLTYYQKNYFLAKVKSSQ